MPLSLHNFAAFTNMFSGREPYLTSNAARRLVLQHTERATDKISRLLGWSFVF
jgi:hypothetical protein